MPPRSTRYARRSGAWPEPASLNDPHPFTANSSTARLLRRLGVVQAIYGRDAPQVWRRCRATERGQCVHELVTTDILIVDLPGAQGAGFMPETVLKYMHDISTHRPPHWNPVHPATTTPPSPHLHLRSRTPTSTRSDGAQHSRPTSRTPRIPRRSRTRCAISSGRSARRRSTATRSGGCSRQSIRCLPTHLFGFVDWRADSASPRRGRSVVSFEVNVSPDGSKPRWCRHRPRRRADRKDQWHRHTRGKHRCWRACTATRPTSAPRCCRGVSGSTTESVHAHRPHSISRSQARNRRGKLRAAPRCRRYCPMRTASIASSSSNYCQTLRC